MSWHRSAPDGAPHRRVLRPRHSARVVRRRRQVAAGMAVALVLAVGALVARTFLPGGDSRAATAGSGAAAPGRDGLGVPTSGARQTTSQGLQSGSVTAPMKVTEHGPGTFVTVPGTVAGPGRGTVRTVRVEVERGTDVDVGQFAAEVMDILNDPRSWGHGGTMTFARTDTDADIRVILASPDTSERMCRPLKTEGTESCSLGDQAILTSYRWAKATREFPGLTLYREYVVNHEVGHVLGHHHRTCPGRGKMAPVMQQQTVKVAPCVANGWPYP